MGRAIMDSSTKQLLAYSLTMMLLSLPCWAQSPTTTSPALPSQTAGDAAQAGDNSPNGDEAIYCRPPQETTGSRFKNPKVCLSVGRWKELHAQGLDVSADGKTIVPAVQSNVDATPGLSGLP
jgi:hypothetical protein